VLMKILVDLVRIGVLAYNIAGAAKRLASEPPLRSLGYIPRMETLASAMLRDALEAFVRRDTESARALCRRDDEVDQLNRRISHDLLTTMIEDPSTISRLLELILVARNLERIADLATNVAEEVVFISEARIIKHHAEDAQPATPSDDDFGRS